ncbi:DUF4136 domain-containing protein [Sulfurimonas sp.]|uniref:DUF4136 domain-containing protein n=1 Tax=Sulfurimonas sp. TaxID=2022749 RepID=UPI003562ACEC
MKNLFLTLLLSIFLGGCSTLHVEVDYNPDYNFSTISTFAVVYTKKGDGKDFTRSRISNLLTKYMQKKGYASVDKSKADFYITINLDIQKRSQIETNYETFGIKPSVYPFVGFRTGLGAMPVYEYDVRVTKSTKEYQERMLVLEVFDVKDNAVVWQGIAKDENYAGSTQEDKSAYLNEVIEKLFKDFPSK